MTKEEFEEMKRTAELFGISGFPDSHMSIKLIDNQTDKQILDSLDEIAQTAAECHIIYASVPALVKASNPQLSCNEKLLKFISIQGLGYSTLLKRTLERVTKLEEELAEIKATISNSVNDGK